MAKLLFVAVICCLVVVAVFADGYGYDKKDDYKKDDYKKDDYKKDDYKKDDYYKKDYGHGYVKHYGEADVHMKKHPYGFSYHMYEKGHSSHGHY